MVDDQEYELAKVISGSFYRMQGGEPDEAPEPNEGDMQLAHDILNSDWFVRVTLP